MPGQAILNSQVVGSGAGKFLIDLESILEGFPRLDRLSQEVLVDNRAIMVDLGQRRLVAGLVWMCLGQSLQNVERFVVQLEPFGCFLHKG
jgi:hypothetical protein